MMDPNGTKDNEHGTKKGLRSMKTVQTSHVSAVGNSPPEND